MPNPFPQLKLSSVSVMWHYNVQSETAGAADNCYEVWAASAKGAKGILKSAADMSGKNFYYDAKFTKVHMC